MNKFFPLFALLCALFLLSCTSDSGDKFIPLADLKINQEALPNGEMVNVIYSPGLITSKEEDYSYYVMVLAVSQKTLDTFKILIFPSFANATPSNNEREFVASNSSNYKLFVGAGMNEDPTKIGEPPMPTQVKMDSVSGAARYGHLPIVIGLLAGGEPK